MRDTFFSIITALTSLASITTAHRTSSSNSILYLRNSDKHRRSLLPETRPKVTPFEYLSSEDIHSTLVELSKKYPEFVTLTDAQSQYKLPAAGHNDCPFDNTSTGCLNYILTIEDKISNPPNSPQSASLPEVFLSGALHGDERIGPTSVVETARLLLLAAHCSSYPRGSPKSSTSTSSNNKDDNSDTTNDIMAQEWENSLELARSCREELSQRSITPPLRRWLSRLVSTRRIVILPTANALGYFRNTRTEGMIDVNRDFPYDLKDYTKCMQSVGGRAINEIFRDHLFQISITFHAGMEAVAYEWGAPSYGGGERAPDERSQMDIAKAYANYGGQAEGRKYPTGALNDLVYPVRGGMEDWAYAGSWDHEIVSECHPRTYGGYPAEKTQYGNGTLRMFNCLVETSNDKTPADNLLGSDEGLLAFPYGKGSGHVARNVRLSLLAIDIVEPYVVIEGVHGNDFEEDVVPLSERYVRSCNKTRAVLVPEGGVDNDGRLELEWTVGGAVTVDETFLAYAKWEDLPDFLDGGLTQPTHDQIKGLFVNDKDEYINSLIFSEEMRGKGRWHPDSSILQRDKRDETDSPFDTFNASIDISMFSEGDQIAVFALAKVDQSWSQAPKNVEPDVPPQTHLANARTNPKWRYETDDGSSVVQGRLYWISVPVTVRVGKATSQFIDISVRNPITDEWDEEIMYDDWQDDGVNITEKYRNIFLMMIILWAGVLCGAILCKVRKIRIMKKSKDCDIIEMSDRENRRLAGSGITVLF